MKLNVFDLRPPAESLKATIEVQTPLAIPETLSPLVSLADRPHTLHTLYFVFRLPKKKLEALHAMSSGVHFVPVAYLSFDYYG